MNEQATQNCSRCQSAVEVNQPETVRYNQGQLYCVSCYSKLIMVDEIDCPACQQSGTPLLEGQSHRCPHCGHDFSVLVNSPPAASQAGSHAPNNQPPPVVVTTSNQNVIFASVIAVIALLISAVFITASLVKSDGLKPEAAPSTTQAAVDPLLTQRLDQLEKQYQDQHKKAKQLNQDLQALIKSQQKWMAQQQEQLAARESQSNPASQKPDQATATNPAPAGQQNPPDLISTLPLEDDPNPAEEIAPDQSPDQADKQAEPQDTPSKASKKRPRNISPEKLNQQGQQYFAEIEKIVTEKLKQQPIAFDDIFNALRKFPDRYLDLPVGQRFQSLEQSVIEQRQLLYESDQQLAEDFGNQALNHSDPLERGRLYNKAKLIYQSVDKKYQHPPFSEESLKDLENITLKLQNLEDELKHQNQAQQSAQVQSWLQQAGGKDENKRVEAYQELLNMGPGIVPDLIAGLDQNNSRIRWTCVLVLESLGTPDALPAIIETLNDPDDQVRFSAIQACGKFASPLAAKPLLMVLYDENLRLVSESVKALEKITRLPLALGVNLTSDEGRNEVSIAVETWLRKQG